jgi:OmpA-OmpF porin, OOP family
MNLMPSFSVLVLVSSIALAQPKFELEGNALKAPTFTFDGEKPGKDSEAALAHVKAYLEAKPYITKLRIEVHTDTGGEQAQKLTDARALAVAQALVKAGVDCKRLIAVGFGDTKPIAPNDTTENKARNRRTVFVNAELRGRAIGGMPLDGGGHVAGDACASK